MNENIDLSKILKDCPKGFKLYSPMFGDVYFQSITMSTIHVVTAHNVSFLYNLDGKYLNEYEYENTECTLFPSKDKRDWSKFTAPWCKKKRFDPKALKPFDKVLVRNDNDTWQVEFFSHICQHEPKGWCQCSGDSYYFCIPYNDETKHLIGTTQDAPQHYRYWEG